MRRPSIVIGAALLAVAPGLVLAGPLLGSTSTRVDGPAAALAPARRDIAWVDGATCDLVTVEAIAARHPGTRQLVVLTTSTFADTFGDAFVAARSAAGEWKCQTATVPARFGRTGTRPLLDRRSGDGSTPAGVFPLAETTAWDGQRFNVFGNRPDPGVRHGIAYRDVRPQDCWGATPNDTDYNKLVEDQGCRGPDDEWLQRFGDVYERAAVIGANMDPISGDAPGETPYAAAIFLHRHSYAGGAATGGATKPTSGCVSVASDALATTIRLLDPDLDPHFAIGPRTFLRTTA